MSHYFEEFEDRRPPAPLQHNPVVEALAQVCLTIALVIGAWYIHWRWTESLNPDALWFSIPLIVAETGAYIGLILFVFNIWRVDDYKKQPPPVLVTDCFDDAGYAERPLSVDVFFPTYDEDEDLVRLSLLDAKKITYPHPINIKIHVLDDGSRPAMAQLADSMGCNYITRDSNIGFKAGNMRNAMEQTSGDFIVICDADTRPFPTILENTLGYFRDPDVAWVQTPQWFFDLPEGKPLPDVLRKWMGSTGGKIGNAIESCFGKFTIGHDPFVNDPKLFYDIILRRRNWANASFCCGAGSIHRREAVMQSALRNFGSDIERSVAKQESELAKLTGESTIDPELQSHLTNSALQEEEFTPYKFHVSEDIFTSIELHSDQTRNWKSVLHPDVESKMLSPQDLQTWVVQRFKYAGGTLDIAFHENLIFRKGLSLPQRLMYASTVWSYFGGIWNAIFLVSPIIYLFLAVAPVAAYSHDFYKHIIPFLFMTELGTLLAMWGLSGTKAKYSYLSFFPLNLRALWTVLRGQKISFPVTSKVRQTGNYAKLVWVQMSIMALTAIGIVYAWFSIHSGNIYYSVEGVLMNTFWGLINIYALSGMVYAAFWQPDTVETEQTTIEVTELQEAA